MRPTFHRSLAVSLALCAMVLRALLPDGWMPAAGAAPFVICAVDGTHSGKAPATPSRERGHAPCAFAAATPLAPPAIAFAAPAATAPTATPPRPRPAAASTAPYRPNAPRAPPAFS